MAHEISLPDIHQKWWHLAAIQLVGIINLPFLMTSISIIQNTNLISSIITLTAANFILFFIRLSIISMSYNNRKNAVDIAVDYLGKYGGNIISILFLLATLAWFIAQTTLGSNVLYEMAPFKNNNKVDRFFQISVFFGILSTLGCMEGIVVLRWISVICFPILLISLIVIILTLPSTPLLEKSSLISLANLPLVLGVNLGVTADLPTFFRHSHSWKDSILALLVIQLISLGISIAAVYLGSILIPWEGIKGDIENNMLAVSLAIFVFVSVVCANVSNIYSASVAWELVAPSSWVGRKEYLILGLGLTLIFISLARLFPIEPLVDIPDNGLVNLCLILFIAYLIKLIFKTSIGKYEKTCYFTALSLATLFNIYGIPNHWNTLNSGILIIVLTIFITFSLKKIFPIFDIK